MNIMTCMTAKKKYLEVLQGASPRAALVSAVNFQVQNFLINSRVIETLQREQEGKL